MNRSFSSSSEMQRNSGSSGAERRLKELGIKLSAPPQPFGTYAEAVQTGNLLFLSGMLPTEGRSAKFIGRVGAELDTETGRAAAELAALNVLAVAHQHLGSLDRVTRVVRLGVSVATVGDFRINRKSRTARPSCCKTSSEKKKILAGWCMASQAFRLAHLSSLK
jgi:enamine deaminase RidA (YjgF/YER057c/UK114 family)